MNQRGVALIYIIVGILILGIIAGGAYYLGKISSSKIQPSQNNQRACTDEAKICPDGSAVGRTGPNCEFTPCSGEKKTDKITTPSNPPNFSNPSNPSTAQEYKIGGTFTEKATEAEIGSLSTKLGSDASSISLLESFPLQFQITSPSQTSCEKVRKALSALKFIDSFGECQKVGTGASGDSNQSIISQ